MNFKTRYDMASREIRKHNIIVKRNVQGCCRSCIWADINPNDQPIIWHYGGQGSTVDLNDFDEFYLSHDGITPAVFEKISAAFDKFDIPWDWNYEDTKCITILSERKTNA